MARIVIFMMVLFAGMTAAAQTNDRSARRAERKMHQEQQKREAAIRDSVNFVKAVEALESEDFVLEANQLIFKRGQSAIVSSSTNFIALRNGKAIVQVAPFNGGGPNGVGGITVEGSPTSIEMETDKRGNRYLSMNVIGRGISASLYISLYNGANRASVTVSPNFNSNQITLNGILLPAECSDVVQGITF